MKTTSKREVIYTTKHPPLLSLLPPLTHKKERKTMNNKFITKRKGETLIDRNILQNRKL